MAHRFSFHEKINPKLHMEAVLYLHSMRVSEMNKIIIGIDPDLIKSGVALYRPDKSLELSCLNLPDLVKLFQEHKERIEKVVIEAGWLIKKSNWHGGEKIGIAENVAKKVGMNHATGLHIECFARALGLRVQLLEPQGKKNHEQFCRITGYQGKTTNPETRDAGLLVFGMPFKCLRAVGLGEG